MPCAPPPPSPPPAPRPGTGDPAKYLSLNGSSSLLCGDDNATPRAAAGGGKDIGRPLRRRSFSAGGSSSFFAPRGLPITKLLASDSSMNVFIERRFWRRRINRYIAPTSAARKSKGSVTATAMTPGAVVGVSVGALVTP